MAIASDNLANRTVVLANNRETVIGKLRAILQGQGQTVDEEKLLKIRSIKEVPGVESPTFVPKFINRTGSENKLTSQPENADSPKEYDLHLKDLNELRTVLSEGLQPLEENRDYLKEDFEKSPDFTGEEEKVHTVLTHTIDILDRAFNRRTTLVSWGLFAYLKYAGLQKDDFDEVKSLCNDTNFIKKYTEYIKLKSIEPEKALEPFTENERKLVKLLSGTTNLYNSFNLGFVKNFPIAFTIENIGLPILGRLFTWMSGEDNFVSRTIEKIMVINPWINEFAESLGNYFKEVENLQKSLNSTQKPEDKLKPISEIELSSFESTDEYHLNKIVSVVDEAAERLVGKGNTVSSIVLKQILENLAGKSYHEFIKDYKDNPVFVKRFKTFLSSGSTTKDGQEVFSNIWDKYVANIVKFSVKAVNSFSDKTLKKITNYFGLTYAVVNPLTPFLSLFIRKGPFAWLLHALRDTLPLINDLCIDHLANFRKEVMDVKKVTSNEAIGNLFPDMGKDLHSFVDNIKGLWNTVKDFSMNLATYARGQVEPQ